MAGRGRKQGGGGQRLSLLVLAAPLLVFVAAMGTRFGGWSFETGHDLLAMRVGVALAAVGVIAAVVLLVSAFRRRAPFWLAAFGLLVSVATVGLYAVQTSRAAAAPPTDVSTDLTEIPGFGTLDSQRGERGPLRTVGVEACPGALPAMTQVPPEFAVYALQQAGFSQQGRVNVGRAAGTHTGFWFGSVHDAVIRIRPGRTDVRVAARHGRNDGEACRLATRISATLRSGG